MSISVAIVEDVKATREDLKRYIDSSPDLFCRDSNVFESAEAFMASFKHIDAQVILMDIHLPGKSGIECIKEIRHLRPDVSFIMCTDSDDDDKVFSALRAGASGYLLKNFTEITLVNSVKGLIEGTDVAMSPTIAIKVWKYFQKEGETEKNKALIKTLSPRELEVLTLRAQGFVYKEIANKLGLKTTTIPSYIKSIYKKLEVHSTTDAVNKAFPRKFSFW